MNIGMNLKKLRNDKDLTQEKLAKILHVNRSAYASYEAERNQPPIDILLRVADYYGVTMDALIGRRLEIKKVLNQYSEKAIAKMYYINKIKKQKKYMEYLIEFDKMEVKDQDVLYSMLKGFNKAREEQKKIL